MRAFSGKHIVGALLSLSIHRALAYVVPDGSPGFYHENSTASVTFDQYSLFLDSNRTLFMSGEFHPFRLPVPALWKDILQKFKASGLNGVSVYWHWGLTSPRQGVNVFKDHNDIAHFLEVAKDVGLLVIARPGPYINAETAGGGFPGWLTNVPALARTNATLFRDAWVPYIKEFAQQAAPYQYPNGPLIGVQAENEFGSSDYYKVPGLNEYMQEVIDTLREGGLNKIPTTHNDNWPKGAFAGPGGLGAVDLYGWDSYPNGFDCTHPDVWLEVDPWVRANHLKLAPDVPMALYELQGGAFDPWMGSGYDKCYQLTNEKFANVFYKNWYSQGAKLHNLYMTYGGTNWGNSATDSVYTSYDYGAPIREDRTLTPKLAEMKTHNYFLHATPAYLTADFMGSGSTSTGTAYSDSTGIFTTAWHDKASGTNLYFVRQTTNNKTTPTEFTLRVSSTVLGNVTVPSSGIMTLDGRESKILVTDYKFGASNLVFSTAEVLTWETFDGADYIYLYTVPTNPVEIVLAGTGNATVPTGFTANATSTYTTIKAAAGRANSLNVVKVGKTTVIIADKAVSYKSWAPRLLGTVGFAHYTPTPSVPGVWVVGPYLVRTANLNGATLELEGDLDADTSIDIWGPSSIKRVTWNGHSVQVSKSQQLGSLQGSIKFDVNSGSITIPDLSTVKWKMMDTTPEIAANYDDSKWVVANKTNTTRPQKPTQGKYVLYGDEYGFHSGNLVWRGHFSGNATGLEIAVQTGLSGAMSAYLNGKFLSSVQGISIPPWGGVDIQEAKYTFTPDMLLSENVVTVYHDSTGTSGDYNVNDDFKNPRGIRGYKLLSDNGNDFTKWTVSGNVGGENCPDTVRGCYNEGGWYYEKIGAHLPGFDDSKWKSGSPLEGRTSAGITAYRATFNLNIPANADIPLSFDLELDTTRYRSMIWVNGWQFGRFSTTNGPQTSYPVPEGILNHQGKNEILVTLWALDGPARMKSLKLTKRAVLSSSKPSRLGLVHAGDWRALRG